MTCYLFARPSFVEGMARVFDFGNTLNEYNYSRSDEEADLLALRNDWEVIGQDLRMALARVKRERAKNVERLEETASRKPS